MNPMIQTLMNVLKQRNPQGYQTASQMMQNGGNPNALLKQMMGNMQPQQKQQLFKSAKQYGVPEDVLSKIQNMK
jgi:hypothetical protein